MPLILWVCGHCNTINRPPDTSCFACDAKRRERHAAIHASERAVAYIHPQTGERRMPARADQPMPDIYAQQGFERVEIQSMTAFERQTGLVHEASNFGTSTVDASTTKHVSTTPDPIGLDDPAEPAFSIPVPITSLLQS